MMDEGGTVQHQASRLMLLATYLCCVLALVGAATVVPGAAGHAVAHATDVNGNAIGSGSILGTTIGANVTYGEPPQDKSTCTWRYSTEIDESTGKTVRIIQKMGDAYYLAYQRRCIGPPATFREYWVEETANSELAKTAAAKAFDDVPTPIIGMAPPSRQSIVKVGTWFWVSRALWHPLSVTASIVTSAGVLWVKTTATPSLVIYSPGDGKLGTGDVSCVGPGRVWKTSDGDLAKSDCMYTYFHGSTGKPNGVFKARMSVEWKVKWKSNLGLAGTLPNVRTGVPINVHVKEIQALAT